MDKNGRRRIRLICTNCNVEWVTYQYWYNKKLKQDKNYVPVCCKCTRSTNGIGNKERYKNRTEEQKREFSEKRSKHMKQYWDSLSDEERKLHSDKILEYWNKLSEEEKMNRLYSLTEGNKQWWDSLTEEERKLKVDNLQEKCKQYWDSLSDEERKLHSDKILEYWNKLSEEEMVRKLQPLIDGKTQYWNSLTDEEKKLHSDKSKQWWGLLSDEEKITYSEKHKQYWNSLTDEEKKLHSDKSKQWWGLLSDEEKKLIINKIRSWWNSLTNNEYNDWDRKRHEGYNNYFTNLDSYITKTEIQFKQQLDLLKFSNQIQDYEFQYVSQIIHDNFNELFPINPVTSSNVSPYHKWDFIIIRNDGSKVLVDIDGSIHDPNKADYEVTSYDGFKINIIDIIKFNDSKRPYQTDGYESYIILAYDDNVSDDTKVLSLQTNDIITVKDLLVLISVK
jgi:hypothetical protein